MESFKERYFGEYNGKLVPLDSPMIEYIKEDAQPELNKPKRNPEDGKKYVVYVKDPETGNVRKIQFGDKKGGLTAKINDKEAAKNFASRHNCEMKTDKMSPGYWACRLPKYAKELGLKGGGDWFW